MLLSRPCLLALALALVAPAAAQAKKNDPNIPLHYAPTTAVAEASAVPTSAMRDVPAALAVEDDRGLDDPRVIGSRSDDDDRRVELLATSDVGDFVAASLADQARRWTFKIVPEAEAELVLAGKLTRLQVQESNQAVGATYEARVTLELVLRDRAGEELWSRVVEGDASRYGKKFSAENANEVLSDALAEALASALDDSGLRRAWGGS